MLKLIFNLNNSNSVLKKIFFSSTGIHYLQKKFILWGDQKYFFLWKERDHDHQPYPLRHWI